MHKPTAPEVAHLSWEEQIKFLESNEDFWNDKNYRDHFETDIEGLRNADAIVMLLPAGKAAHTEAGVAYGLNKKMVLIGEVENPETLYLMFNEQYSDIESFLETI